MTIVTTTTVTHLQGYDIKLDLVSTMSTIPCFVLIQYCAQCLTFCLSQMQFEEVELYVPICCDKCERKLKKHLMYIPGN